MRGEMNAATVDELIEELTRRGVDVVILVGFQRNTLANLVRGSLERFHAAAGIELSEGEQAFRVEMEDLSAKLGCGGS